MIKISFDRYIFFNSGCICSIGITFLGYMTIFKELTPLYLIILLVIYTPAVLLEIGCMQDRTRFDIYIFTMLKCFKYVGVLSLTIGMSFGILSIVNQDLFWEVIYFVSLGIAFTYFPIRLEKLK